MYTTAISYRIPSQKIDPSSLWEVFMKVHSAFRKLLGSLPPVYKLWLVDSGEEQKLWPSKWNEIVVSEENRLMDFERHPLFYIQGEYGGACSNGESQYVINLQWKDILQSLLEVRFNGFCLDGPVLEGSGEPIDEQLQAYRLAKELMDCLGAEECWASLDDDVEYQAGYGPYYANEMVSFHFRREGPQTVIAGLEEGVCPTREMGDMARREAPLLHGYRRNYLRLIDFPWREYWKHVSSGVSLPYRLFTFEDDQRICGEQFLRHQKADALIEGWHEKVRLPIDEGFVSLG